MALAGLTQTLYIDWLLFWSSSVACAAAAPSDSPPRPRVPPSPPGYPTHSSGHQSRNCPLWCCQKPRCFDLTTAKRITNTARIIAKSELTNLNFKSKLVLGLQNFCFKFFQQHLQQAMY